MKSPFRPVPEGAGGGKGHGESPFSLEEQTTLEADADRAKNAVRLVVLLGVVVILHADIKTALRVGRARADIPCVAGILAALDAFHLYPGYAVIAKLVQVAAVLAETVRIAGIRGQTEIAASNRNIVGDRQINRHFARILFHFQAVPDGAIVVVPEKNAFYLNFSIKQGQFR